MDSSSDPTTVHVRAACRGNQDSIGWLVNRLTPQLLSQARYYLRQLPDQVHAAEDLIQEVWAVAFLRLTDLVPQAGRMTPVLSTFLAKTMRHKVLNWLRKKVVAGRGGDPDDEPSALATLTSGTRSVIVGAIERERAGMLATTLEGLDEQDREILVLRGLEGNSYEDLTQLLGVEGSTLRMRYFRACEKLREKLPASVFDPTDD